MQHRRWEFRIRDILEAIGKITHYTRDMDYERFIENSQVVEAVIFNFIIIGEAASRVPAEVVARYPGIPWQVMTGMRNVMVHEYWGVTHRVIWDTLRENLMPLVPALNAVLNDSDKEA